MLFLTLLMTSCDDTRFRQDVSNEEANENLNSKSGFNQNILVPNTIADSLIFKQIPAAIETLDKRAIKTEYLPFTKAKTFTDKAAKKPLKLLGSSRVDSSRFKKKKPGVGGIAEPLTHIIPDTSYVIFQGDTITPPSKTVLQHASSVRALPMVTKENTRFDLSYLDVDQGLRSGSIMGIAVDSIGNIWMTTIEGRLLKYDGVHIMDYTEQFSGQTYVNKMVIDRDDVIWMALDDGIATFDGQTYTRYGSGLLETQTLFYMALDSSQNVWVSTTDGLLKISEEGNTLVAHKYTVQSGLESENLWALYIDSDDTVYFGTDTGLSMFKNETFYHLSPALGLDNTQKVKGISKDRNGDLWFISNDMLFAMRTTPQGAFIDQYDIAVSTVLDMYADSQGRIWIASVEEGLVVVEEGHYMEINTDTGLSSDLAFNSVEDKQGNIWISTFGGGINKINLDSFRHDPYANENIAETINCIYLDSKENLWIGTSSDGMYLYENGVYHHYPMTKDNAIHKVYEDRANRLWIGAALGFYLYENEVLTYYDLGIAINKLFEDANGAIWMEGIDYKTIEVQLLRYSEGALHFFDKSLGQTMNQIAGIAEDNNRRLWFTSNTGLYMYDPERSDTFNVLENVTDLQFNALFFNTDNELLVGALKGMYALVWNDPTEVTSAKIIQYTMADGALADSPWHISDGGDNNLWMGIQAGAKYLEYQEDGSYKSTLYNKDNGFFGNSSYIMTHLPHTNKNIMYWATPKGMSHLVLDDFEPATTAPTLQLNEIRINQKAIDYKQLQDTSYTVDLSKFEKYRKNLSKAVPFYNYPEFLELPHNLNHLTFHFSSLDWNNPNALQYQYKVEELDTNWSPLSKSTEADYRNIPYGDYAFKVRALANSGIYSDTFTYPFSINPPWWHTWWARTILIVMAGLGSYFFIKWRIRKGIAKIQKEREIQDNIRRLKDRALRAQMNPHFIFNTLNGIQSTMIFEGERAANKYIDTLSKLIRQTLDMTGSEKIALSDEIEYLQNYLVLEKLRMDADLSISIEVEDTLQVDQIYIPCMLFQPIIENAIIHGLAPSDKERSLQVNIREQDHYIIGEVIDNGIGRKAAGESVKGKTRKSWATRIIKERIRLSQSADNEEFGFDIVDLYENDIPVGTKVTLKIPNKSETLPLEV